MSNIKTLKGPLFLLLLFMGLPLMYPNYSLGDSKTSTGKPVVGRKAAAKYFAKSEDSATESEKEIRKTEIPRDHYLQIAGGKFINSLAYEWGQHVRQDGLGDLNAAITYRIGQWVNSMDLSLRLDYQEFKVLEKKLNKLAILPVVTFPDAASRFPLYFGGGIGLGAFFNQVSDESSLSLDYQLFLGARFMNIWNSTGFYIESGIKNHFLLLTDGQFNGSFLNFGWVFTF